MEAPVRKGCAIYLVGHGPRRQPRPIELQHARILRYLDALEKKLGIDFWTREVFVDLNWPRTNYWIAEHFPELLKLAGAIREKSHNTIIVDLAPGGSEELGALQYDNSAARRHGSKSLQCLL
jgi:hypothetical protein